MSWKSACITCDLHKNFHNYNDISVVVWCMYMLCLSEIACFYPSNVCCDLSLGLGTGFSCGEDTPEISLCSVATSMSESEHHCDFFPIESELYNKTTSHV